MRWLWNLHETCDSGKRCASWVLTTVKEVVDADSEVGGLAMELLENWPYTKLDGIGFDYTYAGLYRFRSGCWLSDDSILAFTQLLGKEYGNSNAVFLPALSSSVADTMGDATYVVSATALAKIRESLEDDLTGMNKRKVGKVLKLLAREINGRLLEDTFKQTTLTKPRQKDGDSCGVFVCLLFWRQVSSAAPTDVSPEGLVRMRWEMLQALMNQKTQLDTGTDL
ncbi:hypothetical protein DVH05_007057 [Phytophthora capsici]|nr:hypothetical protein DVH05_015583 [Phytophthora capsici]KAG1686246.1 hypothetical protein DVH05_007057 [Phytophthora capsici]